MGQHNNDVIEAQIVEVNEEPLKVDIAPVSPTLTATALSPQARELATKQRLANVPAVTALPNWEDGSLAF